MGLADYRVNIPASAEEAVESAGKEDAGILGAGGRHVRAAGHNFCGRVPGNPHNAWELRVKDASQPEIRFNADRETLPTICLLLSRFSAEMARAGWFAWQYALHC